MLFNMLKTILVAMTLGTLALGQPSIGVNPSTVDFLNVRVNSTNTRQLEITNSGNSDLIISAFLINGNHASQFSLPGNPATPFVINASVTRMIDIRFAPTSIGNKSAILRLVSNDAFSDTLDVPLIGNGLAAQILLTPSTIQFDSVVVGGRAVRTLQISNLGNEALRIQDTSFVGANAADFRFVTPPVLPIIIQPGANPRIIQIEFTPTNGGANSAFLILTSNDPLSPVSNIPLNGLGVFPDIAVSTLALDYDSVVVGLDSTMSVDINNEGVGDLIITDAAIVGPNQSLFLFTDPVSTPITIPPGGAAVTLNIDFVPDSIGAKSAFLIITSNDPNENPVTINLTGDGIKPVIAAMPPAAAYGDVLVGSDSVLTVAIQNLGDAPLTVSDTVFAGQSISQFTVLSMPPLPFTIPVGGAQRLITLQFIPTSAGLKTASLRFVNNDVYRNPLILPLSGTGVEPDIGANPNPLAFGTVEVGQSFTRIVNIRNDGGATLVISDTAFAGTHQAQFSFVNNVQLPITILPESDPLSISVRFTPATAGAKSAALQFFSNDPDENPFSVNLSGTGIQPEIVATPDSLSFGHVRVNRDSIFTLLISNNGTADLRISDTTITGLQPELYSIVNGPALPIVIRPGGAGFPLQLRFAPVALGSTAADLLLTSNDPVNPKFRIPLTGTGALPDIDVVLDTVNFGNTIVDADTVVELAVYNRGAVALSLIDIAVFNDQSSFSVDSASAAPRSVAANDSLLLKLHFSPDSLGAFLDSLRIISDDPDEDLLTLTLIGTGVLPEIVLIDSLLNFGPVKLLDDSIRIVRISNNGHATLVINEAFVTGLNQGQFAVADTTELPLFVPAGSDTSRLSIRFVPAFSGGKIATLNLVHNDPVRNPTQVTLSGRGVEGPRFNSLTFSTVTLDQPLQVEAHVTSDTTLQSVVLQYAPGNLSGYSSSIVMTAGADQVFRGVIDATEITTSGIKTRITATDDYPVKTRRESFLNVLIPENAITHTFADDEVNRWQMFSIPFGVVNPANAAITTMLSDLGAEDDFIWKIYRSDTSGNNMNYLDLDQLQLAGDFGTFQPGNAFWLFLRESDNGSIPTRSLQFPAMETVTTDSFSYILQPGWNQIANPYDFAMNWSQVSSSGKDSLQAYRWDGTAWSQQLNKTGWTPLLQNDFILEPWKGIAVRNNLESPVTIVFHPGTVSGQVMRVTNAADSGWKLAFSVENETNFDVSVVGMDALTDNKNNNYLHPGNVDASHAHGYLSRVGSSARWSSSFAPAATGGAIWYYTVESTRPRVSIRDLHRENFPAEFQLWIYDSKYRQLQLLPVGRQLFLDDIQANEAQRFVIVAGTAEFLEQHLDNVVHLQPTGFDLRQNFPNPFNPATRIRYQVAESRVVKLEVYDILGRQIRTLVNGYQNAGFYEIEWDGKNNAGFETASGIYFYRLRSGASNILTKRMLKIK